VQNIVNLRCREIVELLRDQLDGRLAPADAVCVEQHLHACTWCMTYLDQMRTTIALLGELRRP
jgi:predicted anti-sigma-YlaC factor YlaD